MATFVVLERQDSERMDLSFTCPTATVCKRPSRTRTNCPARTERVAASTTLGMGCPDKCANVDGLTGAGSLSHAKIKDLTIGGRKKTKKIGGRRFNKETKRRAIFLKKEVKLSNQTGRLLYALRSVF